MFWCCFFQYVHPWPKDSVPEDNPQCVDYDGSQVPDCGHYLQNDITSYYHIHEYSQSPSCNNCYPDFNVQTAAGSGSAAPRARVCLSARRALQTAVSAVDNHPSLLTADISGGRDPSVTGLLMLTVSMSQRQHPRLNQQLPLQQLPPPPL